MIRRARFPPLSVLTVCNIIFLAPRRGRGTTRAFAIISITLTCCVAVRHIFISRFHSLYRGTAFRSALMIMTKRIFFRFQSTQPFYRPRRLLLFEHCAIIIIPRTSFFRPGIDGIINKHHANYSTTRDIINIFFSPPRIVHPGRAPDVTINHFTRLFPHVYFCVCTSLY